MAKFKLALNGQEADVEATRQGNQVCVTLDGETAVLHIIHATESELLLEREYTDGRRQQIRVAGHVAGDKRQLWVNGRFLNAERIRERGDADVGDDSLAASIPAVVSEILVQPGDAVSAGDKLILLESMKMVIPILAPYDGIVTAIHCTTGESVQAGMPLIELDDKLE